MAPTSKAKAAGVSASSFMDLKAELAKKEEEFAKNRALGRTTVAASSRKRSDKKISQWAKANKGVESRSAHDVELEAVSKHTLDSARAILERKAQVYEKLRKGKSGGLNDAQYNSLLVDFESKPIDAYESDSDDVDESLVVPKPPGEEDEDPIIEYEDEFGRVRTGRRSEVPRHLLKEEEEDIDPFVIYNPQGYFPTYQPSEERLAAIKAQFSEEDNPLNIHYDASHEVRAKGAAFYQFSGDEETRKKQMEELRKAREETEKTRQEVGAVDVLPGEVEGMVAPTEREAGPTKSRALEKRKRDLEERRKLLDAKRRKKDAGSSNAPGPASAPPLPGTHLQSANTEQPRVSPAPGDAQDKHTPRPQVCVEAAAPSRKGKEKVLDPLQSADAFLASLEKDIMQGSKR